MSAPPKYPRVPHVAPSPAATADDVVLDATQRSALLSAQVVVEEKLDGMNVVVWVEGGVPRVGTRGGADTSDRSGERGRLRRWAAMRADELGAGLGSEFAIYGEWLRRRHAVPYLRLPAELVAFDVLDRTTQRLLSLGERDLLLAKLGLPKPPERFRGVLGALDRLDSLLGASAFADARAEGLVIRTVDGGQPQIAKHIDPAWPQIGEAAWGGDNRLAVVAGSGGWTSRSASRCVGRGWQEAVRPAVGGFDPTDHLPLPPWRR